MRLFWVILCNFFNVNTYRQTISKICRNVSQIFPMTKDEHKNMYIINGLGLFSCSSCFRKKKIKVQSGFSFL